MMSNHNTAINRFVNEMFRNGKTTDQLNIEMVQHFVKKGLSDKLPEGMLEKYGDVANEG